MSQPYVGEIRMFGGNFAPSGWMLCQGQLLAIAENDTLFNLIGTTYGGDGQENFALPDLQGRIPIHQGTNPKGGSTYVLAQNGGVETVTLTTQQIPIHNHTSMMGTSSNANDANAVNNVVAQATSGFPYLNAPPPVAMAPGSVSQTGGNQPHDNFQPYLCINFIISLFGIFPHQ
jgi:microcystin-dependent protein